MQQIKKQMDFTITTTPIDILNDHYDLYIDFLDLGVGHIEYALNTLSIEQIEATYKTCSQFKKENINAMGINQTSIITEKYNIL
jgi:hypothetical protein